MPYTRKQVAYLLSKKSPLTPAQQERLKKELHDDPQMGHKKKGTTAMKRGKE